MIDSFVLLTPILMIGVVALLVFVGCDQVFGLERVEFPTNLAATTRSQRVDLTWSGTSAAKKYFIWRHIGAAAPVKIATLDMGATSYTDTDMLANGTEYLYQISLKNGDGDESGKSEPPVPATPNPVAFVKTLTLTTARNNFTGFVGMGIQVVDQDLSIVQLGRPFGLGNNQMHRIKIVYAASMAEVGSVMLDTNLPLDANQTPRSIGDFQYASLAAVPLIAGATYYILSDETSGGDSFYRHDATVTTKVDPADVTEIPVATVLGAFFEQVPDPIANDAPPPMIYPVDFKY